MRFEKGHVRLTANSCKGQTGLEARKRMNRARFGGLIATIFTFFAVAVSAQNTDNRVGVHTKWSVFEATPPAQCWSVAKPVDQVNTRNGAKVTVTRSETLLFVSFIPSSGVIGQVSFTGGYPFREGSTVTLDVAGTKFELFTKDEMAWSASEQDDKKIVTAMKRGAEAVLTGVSTRGTNTKDTFSLFGFTAAYADAEKRCGF